MKLSLGKLPPELLSKYIVKMAGASSKALLLPPRVGLDFGVVKVRDRFLIVSSDPVTGVVKNIGWHAVVVSANDVATSGNGPQFMQSVILLPPKTEEDFMRALTSQIGDSARKLGITVVGGHTELTPGLKRPVVMTTAFALVESFVTAGGAQVGDTIMVTKSAGIEGTAILADEAARRGVDSKTASRAASFTQRMSVVDEAERGFRSGFVHAMHDCTEGGILGAIYEMSSASGIGFEAHEGKVPVARETREICSLFKVDPLKLISSGALLLAVAPGGEEAVGDALEPFGAPVTPIGRFVAKERTLVRRGGRRTLVKTSPSDELWKIERRNHLIST